MQQEVKEESKQDEKKTPDQNPAVDSKPTEPVTEKQEEKEEKPEDPNWRAFREARKRDRQEKEAAERRAREKEEEARALREAMEAAFNRQANQTHVYQDTSKYTNYGEPEETEEQRLEKIVEAAIQKKQQLYEQEMANRQKQELPNMLRKSFPDFDQVVTPENLDYLEFHYPEIARPIGRVEKNFDTWSDIYRAVKRFVPNSQEAKQDALKAQENQQKPKSISSTQVTGTETAGAVSSYREIQERRAANWADMKRRMKGLG